MVNNKADEKTLLFSVHFAHLSKCNGSGKYLGKLVLAKQGAVSKCQQPAISRFPEPATFSAFPGTEDFSLVNQPASALYKIDLDDIPVRKAYTARWIEGLPHS